MFRFFVHIKVRLPVTLVITLVALKQIFKRMGRDHMVPQTCLVGSKVTKLTVLVPGTPGDATLLVLVVIPMYSLFLLINFHSFSFPMFQVHVTFHGILVITFIVAHVAREVFRFPIPMPFLM